MLSKIELKESLFKSVAKVVFNKSDGSIREMVCTLMPKYLPEQIAEKTNTRKDNDSVLAVWDIEKESWRSFRLDSIVDVEYIKKEI